MAQVSFALTAEVAASRADAFLIWNVAEESEQLLFSSIVHNQ
jgi:hypothetical protein